MRVPILDPFFPKIAYLAYQGPSHPPKKRNSIGLKTELYWTWLADLPFTAHVGFLVAPGPLLGGILAARRT